MSDEGKTLMKKSGVEPVAKPAPPPPATQPQDRVSDVLVPFDARRFAGAGTLRITPEEAAILTAPLAPHEIRHDDPNTPGARRDASGDLICYLCHDVARARLLRAFGPGQWALVPVDDPRARRDDRAVTVLQTWDLYVRGVFVGRAVGDGTYYPNNPKTTERDAIESCASVALRTICQKFLGMGLELFDRDRRRELLALKARANVITDEELRALCIAQREAGITDEAMKAWLVENLGPWCDSRKKIPQSELPRVRRWISGEKSPIVQKAPSGPKDANGRVGRPVGPTTPSNARKSAEPPAGNAKSMAAAARQVIVQSIIDGLRERRYMEPAMLRLVEETVGVKLRSIADLHTLSDAQLARMNEIATKIEVPF